MRCVLLKLTIMVLSKSNAEVLDEEDLIKLGGLDKYMKNSVTDVLGDYEEDEDEEYEDLY